jgi:hypothetical protein
MEAWIFERLETPPELAFNRKTLPVIVLWNRSQVTWVLEKNHE